MVYYGYRPPVRVKKHNCKNWVIAGLVIVVALLLGVVLNLKSAYSLREYSIANDCTWTWQGTAYGDNRDYICK